MAVSDTPLLQRQCSNTRSGPTDFLHGNYSIERLTRVTLHPNIEGLTQNRAYAVAARTRFRACGDRSGTSQFLVAQRAPGFLRCRAQKTKNRKKKKERSAEGVQSRRLRKLRQ